MTEMAHAIVAKAERSKEGQDRHDDHESPHFQRNGDRKKIDTAIGEKDGTSDQNSKNGARRSYGGNVSRVRQSVGERGGSGSHKSVDESCPDAGQEVIPQKLVPSPNQLQLLAEQPQRVHVHDDVPDALDVVEEQVRDRLPDA